MLTNAKKQTAKWMIKLFFLKLFKISVLHDECVALLLKCLNKNG